LYEKVIGEKFIPENLSEEETYSCITKVLKSL